MNSKQDHVEYSYASYTQWFLTEMLKATGLATVSALVACYGVSWIIEIFWQYYEPTTYAIFAAILAMILALWCISDKPPARFADTDNHLADQSMYEYERRNRFRQQIKKESYQRRLRNKERKNNEDDMEKFD